MGFTPLSRDIFYKENISGRLPRCTVGAHMSIARIIEEEVEVVVLYRQAYLGRSPWRCRESIPSIPLTCVLCYSGQPASGK